MWSTDIASLKYYLKALTHKDKENYDNSLFKYTESNATDDNNLDDFDIPPQFGDEWPNQN